MSAGQLVVIESGSSGDLVVWLTFLLAVGSVAFTIYWNLRTEKRGYLDEYWFRQVVAPKCIDPILKLHDKWTEQLEGLHVADWTQQKLGDWNVEFEEDLGVALGSMWTARIFPGEFYGRSSAALFSIEDAFAEQCGDVLLGRQTPQLAKEVIKKTLEDGCVAVLVNAARLQGGAVKTIRNDPQRVLDRLRDLISPRRAR